MSKNITGTDFYLEAGINHFGKDKHAKKILNYFLKSKFSNLTFMLHNENFYKTYLKKGIDFSLSNNFYERSLTKCHIKKKKLGLAVCSLNTFKKYSDIEFDFYKLLSVGINQFDLIKELIKKKKPIFVSTGFKVTDYQIKKCLKLFKTRKNLSLLHSPMSYNLSELNFPRINRLKKIYKLDVGYSNHCSNKNTLNVLTAYKPKSLFLYCKPIRKKRTTYPDDKHAFFLDELNDIIDNFNNCSKINSTKKMKNINIFSNEIKY